MVVNTKEALQLEVGSVSGGLPQCNPPRSTPNPLILTHTYTLTLLEALALAPGQPPAHGNLLRN